MKLYTPENFSSKQYINRIDQLPPFWQMDIIPRTDCRYEDTVYSMSGAFIKLSPDDWEQATTIDIALANATSPMNNTLKSLNLPSMSLNGSQALAAWMSEILKLDDFQTLDPEFTELWFIYNAETQQKAREFGSKLVRSPFPNTYAGAEAFGLLNVMVGDINIPISVFGWLDDTFEGLAIMVDNSRERNMQVNMPEDFEPTYRRIMHEMSDLEYEKLVWRDFTAFLSDLGVSYRDDIQEPNRLSDFPDWGAVINEKPCEIEITRLMKGIFDRRIIDATKKPVVSEDDPRISRAAANAKFSEDEFRESIRETLHDKSMKSVAAGNGYVLIITNDFFKPMESWFRIWDDQNFEKFDIAFLGNYDRKSQRFEFQPLHPYRLPHPCQSQRDGEQA